MIEITDLINYINIPIIISLGIALGIVVLFNIISPIVSKLLIKIIIPIKKEKIKYKKHPLYSPFKILFTFVGIYVAMSYIKSTVMFNIEIIDTIYKILNILMILLLAKAFSKGLELSNAFRFKINKEIDPTTHNFIIKLLRIIIYTIAIFLVITELGYDLTGLIAGLGVGGVMITLAAQDTAKSLIGGFAVFIDKPYKIGDYIKVGQYEGTVEEIKLRSTNIRTLENSVLHIPNSEMSISSIINYNEMNTRRYYTKLTLELDTDISKMQIVEGRIKNMLMADEFIIPDTIVVRFQTISDNGNDITVIAYINEINYAKYLEIKENINYKILSILREEKVDLAYNTQTVIVKR